MPAATAATHTQCISQRTKADLELLNNFNIAQRINTRLPVLLYQLCDVGFEAFYKGHSLSVNQLKRNIIAMRVY